MSIPVTFNGGVYSIPEKRETGWSDLTSYLVALSNAAVQTSMTFNVRVANTTPQTLQSTDAVLCMNVGSASAVTIPTGVTGQFYGIYDSSGAAFINNITITPSGGQTISGSATYIIRTNYGGILLQFNGVSWQIVSEVNPVLRPPLQVANNGTNPSYVDASITANSAFATAANLTSSSSDFLGTNTYIFTIALSTGESIECHTSFLSSLITAVSDPANIFLSADAGTGIYVTKSASNANITFKNRMGGSRDIEIKSITARLSTVTAWA